MLDDLAQRGRKGITLMRELLAERGPDYRPNDTNLEDRFQDLCKVVGLVSTSAKPARHGRVAGRVDFVSEKLMLVIEVDSALYHDAIIDQKTDEPGALPSSPPATGPLVHRPRDLPRPRGHAPPPRAIRSGA